MQPFRVIRGRRRSPARLSAHPVWSLVLYLGLLGSSGCGLVREIGQSLPMKSAVANTNPPDLVIKSFESHWLEGEFVQASAPKMFLWPTEKSDPQTGEMVSMDLDEQAKARETIAVAAATLQFLEAEIARVQREIMGKYNSLQGSLIAEYRAKKCYSYCNPEDFIFCDPSNENVLFIEDWLVTDDPQIQEIIAQCQVNQEERQDLESAQGQELQAQVRPLQEAAAQQGQVFFGTLGDNYFTHFTRMEIDFSNQEQPSIRLEFGDHVFSSEPEGSHPARIHSVRLDLLNGYLEFISPLVSANGSPKGEIFFDLELTFLSANTLKLEGDVRHRQVGQVERVGRLAIGGTLGKARGMWQPAVPARDLQGKL